MDSEQIDRSVDDLIHARSKLRDKLLASPDCEVITANDSEQPDSPLQKYVFRVRSKSLAEDVRVYVRQLNRLSDFLEDVGVTVADKHRIWLPAVADEGAGDHQLTLTRYENWSSCKTTVSEVIEDFHPGANGEGAEAMIDRQAEGISELRKCRESGKSYRIVVVDEEWNRKTHGLNQFCVLLGDVRYVEEQARKRKPRADAWRGKDEALFSYVSIAGHTWHVYAR